MAETRATDPVVASAAAAGPSSIYFCPGGDRAATLTRRDLPMATRAAVADLHRIDLRWNLVIPFHFALWLGAGWLAVSSDSLAIDLACTLAGGMALGTLSVLAHESAHDLLTRRPKVDTVLGFLCGLPLLFSTYSYRIQHSAHHARLKTAEDPDNVENLSKDPRTLRLAYVVLFFLGAYVYLVHVPVEAWKRASPRKRRGIVVDLALIAGIGTLAWTLLPARTMLEAWLFPLLVAVQIANVRGLAEHGLTTGGNEFTDARTVATWPVLSFLMCNINYHLEHHLWPAVPWYRLPRVHRLLQDEYRRAGSSAYRGYGAFLTDVVRALWRGAVPGRRVIPSAIRRDVCL